MFSKKIFSMLAFASLIGYPAFAACPAGHQPYKGSSTVCINPADKDQPLFMAGCDKASGKLALELIQNIENQAVANEEEQSKRTQLSGLMRVEFNFKCANIDVTQEKWFFQNWLKN